MKFQVLMRSCVATYIFDLEPITVERIDVLESRVRDLQAQLKTLQPEADHNIAKQQKEVRRLQLRLDNREASISNLEQRLKALEVEVGFRRKVIQTQATSRANHVIIWKEVEGHLNGTDGIIRNLDGGLYAITATLSYVAPNYDQVVQLMKGTECIHTSYCVYSDGHPGSSTMATIVRVRIDEQLYFQSMAKLPGQHTCYLTLVRLGN